MKRTKHEILDNQTKIVENIKKNYEYLLELEKNYKKYITNIINQETKLNEEYEKYKKSVTDILDTSQYKYYKNKFILFKNKYLEYKNMIQNLTKEYNRYEESLILIEIESKKLTDYYYNLAKRDLVESESIIHNVKESLDRYELYLNDKINDIENKLKEIKEILLEKNVIITPTIIKDMFN